MNQPKPTNRRLLINLIVILAIVQAGILVYLRQIWRQDVARATDPPTPTVTPYQLPVAANTSEPEPTEVASSPANPSTAPTEAAEIADVAVSAPVPATDYAARAIVFDVERAMAHVAHLASDALGGRQPGTPGGRAAGDYVAQQFAAYSLQPAGANGGGKNDSLISATYFQTFTVPYGRITETPIIEVTSPDSARTARPYVYRTDYRALTGGYLGAGEGESQVIWLNECLHDDYADLDVTGQIVLCRYIGDSEVYRQAIEHQVGGLLLLDRENQISPYRRPAYRETAWVPETIPAFVISETIAIDLLAGTDYTLDDLSLRFSATPLSTTVRVAVATEEKEEVTARNVLGLLPGADPAYAEEIVVIGAHYDHLGCEPDGAVMNGANDNASGVAAMLEIARLWRDRGIQPARSVLFAAWDAEEMGLLGSQYYVDHPTLPLTQTVAMLNLDMIGSGEMLNIDGEGPVVEQFQASAESGPWANTLTTTVRFVGSSDHMSFHWAGIPGGMLIYWPDPYYHSVDDKFEVVDPGKLWAAGVLAAHTLSAFSQEQIELERAVERFCDAVLSGDRWAFLDGIDPRDPDLRAAQMAWFENVWSHNLTHVIADPGLVRVGDKEAQVELTLTYRWSDLDRRQSSVTQDVCFVQRDGAWYFGGYELDERAGDTLTVSRFPDVPASAAQLLTTTRRSFLSLANDLGFRPITGTRIIYYPNIDTLRALARPASEQNTRWLVSSAGLAEIAHGQAITPALVNLALNQMGLPPGEGHWLRQGLASHYEADSTAEYLPILAVTDVPTALFDLSASEARRVRSHAWSATEYLLQRYGPEGLRALCAAWEPGEGERAFREGLGLQAERFEAGWRADWIAPLHADAEAIREVLDARTKAVLAGAADAFLATINPADPALRTEEREWFARLAEHVDPDSELSNLAPYRATADIVHWVSDGDEIVTALTVTTERTGEAADQITYDARFVRDGRRWYYAGIAWQARAGRHFVLKYQGEDWETAWAEHVLALAEEAYAQLVADLGGSTAITREIKVYSDAELYRAAAGTESAWRGGQVRPGEAIQILLDEDENENADSGRVIQHAIARALTSQHLLAQGAKIVWLQQGLADFEASQVIPLGTHWVAGRYLPIVQEAIRRHEDLSLDALSNPEALEAGQIPLAQAQSWALVAHIAEAYGRSALRRFVDRAIAANDTEASLRQALGVEPDAFMETWRERARIAYVPDDLMTLARRFDVEQAMGHVRTLASPAFGGREAGTQGGELAADYVAGQFKKLGLVPLGDPLAPTNALTSTTATTTAVAVASPVTATATPTRTGAVTETRPISEPISFLTRVLATSRDYVQRFPISHTHLVSVPVLSLLDDDGEVLYECAYHDEFVDRAGEGAVQGELIWTRADRSLDGVDFGGGIALYQYVRFSRALADQLEARGASGVVIVTEAEADDLPAEHLGFEPGDEVGIPVVKITEATFETLLAQLDMTPRDLRSTPPVLPLGAQLRAVIARAPVTRARTANVLGFLPGSDPRLADEIILIGAHYDHAGRSPGNLYFPGANQNGSGVAAMLELARIWQSSGYHPARSVLFATWGAEEKNSAGVARYLENPVVPFTDIVSVIALDSIAGGNGHKLLFYGTRERDQALIQRIESGVRQLERRTWRRGSTGEGWHEPFSQAGIPTVKFIWDEAEDEAYSPNDTAAALDPERLANSGEILALTISWLAR